MTKENSISKETELLPQKTTVYTEVSPERAEMLIRGELNTDFSPPLRNQTRWFAEQTLEFYHPPELKEKGITRNQKIYASPVPFQGHNPIEGKVLLALDVNAESVYVAEADHVTEFWHFGSFGMGNMMTLLDIIHAPSEGVTQAEFKVNFEGAPQEVQSTLLEGAKALAMNYWNSVVPFREYIRSGQTYFEPEILMTPETEFSNIKYA